MEKSVRRHDMECMKMAMLKHEETFKQQVYELHRLYQIQKILMKNIQRSIQDQESWSSLKNGKVCFDYKPTEHNLEQPASTEYDTRNNRSLEIEPAECEIELTLGPTSYSPRKLKPTSQSTSMASFSSSSTGSSDKSRLEIENSRVLNAEERVRRVDRSLEQCSWLCQVLI